MSNLPISNSPLFSTEGHGPVVILFHGLFVHREFWRSTTDALKKHYQVITLQLPYYDSPFEKLSLRYLAKVLNDFIFWRRFSEVTIIAHGVGGQVALLCDHFYPGKITKLILSGTPLGCRTELQQEPTLLELVDRQYITGRVTMAFADPARVPQDLIDVAYHTLQNIPRRLAAGSITRASQRFQSTSVLGRMRIPVLLLWGYDDRITPPEEALAFYDVLPVAELKFIKDCGHLPMVEQPQEFNHLIADFLASAMRNAAGY